MRWKVRKAARSNQRACHDPDIHAESCSLLELPVEVLHQVLSMLSPQDLVQVLPTSKGIAQEVMQHSAGRLIMRVKLQDGVKWEAIRQVLQWAPPSSLKLLLSGSCEGHSDWGVLSHLFGLPCTPLQRLPGQHLWRFPCISSACFEHFKLPGLVPAQLASACPNMHTLHLTWCTIHAGSSSSSKCRSSGGSSSCKAESNALARVQPAEHLQNIILHFVEAPSFSKSPTANARLTRSMQPAATYMKQLKSIAPNIRCLKLVGGLQALPVLGPQLQELVIDNPADEVPPGIATHLQQLQKLVLPATQIWTAADMDQLLSLPSVTHLEIDSVSKELSKDYSSHDCKWQYLHLHVRRTELPLCGLAKLPLHSLTQPLELGGKDCTDVRLCVPLSSQENSHLSMERLAQQLTRCGVQLGGRHVTLSGDNNAKGVDIASSLTVIAPALGPQKRVALARVTVDQPILEALVSMCGHSLKQLDLRGCWCVKDMQAAWHVALSSLPSLDRLDLYEGTYYDVQTFFITLAAAMAQQPAGRCFELVVHKGFLLDLKELAAMVKFWAARSVAVGHLMHEKEQWLSLHLTTVHGL